MLPTLGLTSGVQCTQHGRRCEVVPKNCETWVLDKLIDAHSSFIPPMPCQNITTTCHVNAEHIKNKTCWIKQFNHDDPKIEF